MAQSNDQHLVTMFSEPRFAPFLSVTKNNPKNALRLYRWNLKMSSSFHTLLASTEVLLRNAIDRELRAWNKAQVGFGEGWLLAAPSAPLASLTGAERASATKKADTAKKARQTGHPRHNHKVTHDDVLAQVSFAMWRDLMPNFAGNAADNPANAGRKLLWDEALSNCFPKELDGGKETYWRVVHLYNLRNRVSHMESLLEVDLDSRMRDLEALVKSIDLSEANWILAEKKETTDLIARRSNF